MNKLTCILLGSIAALCPSLQAKTADGKPLVVLIAGKRSHGPGEHEHNAGVQLFAKCLAQGAPNIGVKVHLNAEWPSAEELGQADSVLIYSDGGGGHPALQGDHLAQLDKEMKRGCGFVCVHYAVEVPTANGGPQFLNWLGGYFEENWSVNPHWKADYSKLPQHPISGGVKPFSTTDEWYYHMRFPEGMKGVTPILTDLPPKESLSRKDGPHEGNPEVRAAVLDRKEPQHTAWAVERADGGRGFGFTGGHFHRGWGNDDQRKLVLNAIVWSAKADVPANGIESKVSAEDLEANLDDKGQNKPKPAAAAKPVDGDAHATPVFATDKVERGPVAIKADLKGAKQLHLVVTDAGDGFSCDWADWLNPVLVKSDGSKVKLTDLKWTDASSGFGRVNVGKNCGGKPLTVRGAAQENGIGAHAPSLISYDLPDGVVGFEAQGALDDDGFNQGGGSTVTFAVYTTKPAASALQVSQGNTSDANRYGWEAAAKNMSTFKTPAGLSASLFAAEPMIQNPTNIAIDHRGRIWATEAVDYRLTLHKQWGNLRPDGDRVVILEDSDNDGRADKETTFWQSEKLLAPLGICVLPQAKGTKVIVSAAPNVWLLTDEDGDDKADKSEILFTVGGNWDHDHQVHAFTFGADGKFYFNFGNEGRKLLWPDGTLVKDLKGNDITEAGKPYRQGMVFRCDIDLKNAKATNVEVLGNNFRNNYEVCVDSFGTMWQSDNDDDGNKGVRINYVMDYGNFGFSDEMTGAGWQAKRTNMEAEIPKRHWHQNDPGVVPNLLLTGGGSPTGILINEGNALGSALTNQLIHCDAGPRTTRAYPVEKDGAGYKATMVDVLTSSDSWYRPSDLAIAPDGSLYVSDWYDPGVGGHNMGDREQGKIMGRIYRVAQTGMKPQAASVDVSTAAGAIAALQSPNLTARYMGWKALNEMGAKAEAELLTLWKNENPRLRSRALGLLAQIPGSETKYLTAGFTDSDSDVRCMAIRLTRMMAMTRGFDTSSLEDNREVVRKLLTDSSKAVRREIAVSLHGTKDIEKLWAALAVQHDGKDRWYLEALGIGAAGNEDACFDAWMAANGGHWNTPAGRDIIWRLRSAKSAGFLAKLIADANVPNDEKPRYMRSFDFLPASSDRTKALVELATAGNVADSLAREALVRLKGTDLNKEPSVSTALKEALAKAKGTPQFVELVRDFGMKGQGEALLATAIKLNGDPLTVDAVRLLLNEPNSEQVIATALTTSDAPATLAVLGNTGTQRGLDHLVKLAKDAGQKLELRQDAVRALARTQTGAERLVKLGQENQFPEDLKLTASSALALVQYANLKDQIAQLFPMPNALGGQPLPPIAELAKTKGDVALGKAIFERAESSCVTCHRVGDKGVDFGPALSEIGSKLPKEALFEAIINPNAGVSMGFETWQLTLKDGGGALGLIRSETAEEVVLALPAGATTKVAKANIAKRQKLANSMMPSGLNQSLSKDDLVNLVEYLVSLKVK